MTTKFDLQFFYGHYIYKFFFERWSSKNNQVYIKEEAVALSNSCKKAILLFKRNDNEI